MYTTDQLFQDASGYGSVVAVYQARAPVRIGKGVAATMRTLDLRDAATFLDERYCQIIARGIPHLYRIWDTNERPPGRGTRQGALMLGRLGAGQRGLWMSPMRPTHMVDYRHFAAIKDEWNRGDFVLEVSLLSGAAVFVGRAAAQSELINQRLRQLGGGAIQFFVPRDQFGYLRLQTWWAVP